MRIARYRLAAVIMSINNKNKEAVHTNWTTLCLNYLRRLQSRGKSIQLAIFLICTFVSFKLSSYPAFLTYEIKASSVCFCSTQILSGISSTSSPPCTTGRPTLRLKPASTYIIVVHSYLNYMYFLTLKTHYVRPHVSVLWSSSYTLMESGDVWILQQHMKHCS